MARVNIVVPHLLPQDEALRRIRGEIENLKGQHGDKLAGLRDGWNKNVYACEGKAMGFSASGVMMVKLLQVEIDAELPWLAMLFKGRIEAEIREWLRKLLS